MINMKDSYIFGKARIEAAFTRLKQNNQKAFIPFISAGDPDYITSLNLIKGLPKAGADLVEIGMPFSDPMADGPIIQASALRALKNGQTLAKTLDMVADFRKEDQITPIILMGYYNPIYRYGVDAFLKACKHNGADGLIIVDLPPEEDQELCLPANQAGISFIRLITPTSTNERLQKILPQASGFLYYVSMTGITGSKTVIADQVETALTRLRTQTQMPIAVGFGIKTPDQAVNIARHADAVVAGSVLVEMLEQAMSNGNSKEQAAQLALQQVQRFSTAVHSV